jgi:hypothetical protein
MLLTDCELELGRWELVCAAPWSGTQQRTSVTKQMAVNPPSCVISRKRWAALAFTFCFQILLLGAFTVIHYITAERTTIRQ